MAWDDPAPPRATRPSPRRPAPGYGDPGVRLSFMTIVARTAVALFVGGLAYAGLHAGVLAWQGGGAGAHRPMLGIVLPLGLAIVVAWLVLRSLLRRPPSVGLSDRVRNGGGWWGGRRSWDDGYVDSTVGAAVAIEVIGNVIGDVIDAAID